MNDDQNPFVGEEQDQYCWREPGRPCGLDCTAYDERCETDPLWKPCLLLNIQRAQAKSFANIAVELKRQNDFYESEAGAAVKRIEKQSQAAAYARQIRESDPGPPEIK